MNDRLQSIYKAAGLEQRLCKLASSTNNAWHRSVQDGPKRMNAEDQREFTKRAKARLHARVGSRALIRMVWQFRLPTEPMAPEGGAWRLHDQPTRRI